MGFFNSCKSIYHAFLVKRIPLSFLNERINVIYNIWKIRIRTKLQIGDSLKMIGIWNSFVTYEVTILIRSTSSDMLTTNFQNSSIKSVLLFYHSEETPGMRQLLSKEAFNWSVYSFRDLVIIIMTGNRVACHHSVLTNVHLSPSAIECMCPVLKHT